MKDLVPVILCGGSGTRLWPLSREIHPKPFVEMEKGRSLFRDTLERVLPLNGAEPVIVCNEEHRFFVAVALAELGLKAAIILEPAPRNTAPAVALAALALRSEGRDPLMLVLPSDHAIADAESFRLAVARAMPLARSGRIVTFGIVPTRPESGYGYIAKGEALGEDAYSVARFVEKPAQEQARELLRQGGHYWNSGIFLLSASVYLNELEKFAPKIYAASARAFAQVKRDGLFLRPAAAEFLASPADSLDYAVMEHTRNAALIPLAAEWSDLGSWESFYQAGSKDEQGNVCKGDVLAMDAKGCYLHAQSRLLCAIGLDDLIVLESSDAVLVLPRAKAEEVKRIVAQLKAAKRSECREPAVVPRPWGTYEGLARGARFQVKHIYVEPGAALSLQVHRHRAEHWVVVAGCAEVTTGSETRILSENQSTYIPQGTMHRLRNPGPHPLELIEIQSGDYLGEDDIERLDDQYGRLQA